MAILCLLLGNYPEAEKTLKTVARLTPRDPRIHDLLGKVESRLGKDEEALEALRRTVELRPRNADYHFNLGLKALQLQRFKEAAAAFGGGVNPVGGLEKEGGVNHGERRDPGAAEPQPK